MIPRYGLDLRRALRIAELLGFTVESKPGSGEILVRHRNGGKFVRLNARRKDAPRALVKLLRRAGRKSRRTPAAPASCELAPLSAPNFGENLGPGTQEDPWAVRDSVIPLPTPADGYTRVLFLGSTGAGKTTLVRQLAGTDPRHERFPSTSTAKTTVFDVEIVLAEGPYRAIVSFLPRDRVRLCIEECVVAAITAAADGAEQEEVAQRLLEHKEQRFRLSYLLGSFNASEVDAADVFPGNNGLRATEPETPEVSSDERGQLEAQLRSYLTRVGVLAKTAARSLAMRLGMSADALESTDRDVFMELLEDDLLKHEEAQSLIDEILYAVESRFRLLKQGDLKTDHTGWPISWVFETKDRGAFIKTVNRFSSNYAPHFGRLLTPVVQGLRVVGPFKPDWHPADEIPKLVLMDGEGLGHTSESVSSLPTALTKRYEQADAILVVDSATQPMGAATQAVLRSVLTSGHESKLILVFTHFDQVKGDNLSNETAKRNHLRASLGNAINGVDAGLAWHPGRSLRRHLKGKTFFVGGIEEALLPQRQQTRSQLSQLIEVLRLAIATPTPIEAAPIYDMAKFALPVACGARLFQKRWDTKLASEHWARVKALTRRLGYWGKDTYETLAPVADLIALLSEQVRVFIEAPGGWKPAKPSEEACQAATNRVGREFFSRLHAFASDRVWQAWLQEWKQAYDLRGPGSGNQRKRDVKFIYSVAAPLPSAALEPKASEFLEAMRSLFKGAALAAGADVIQL